MFKVLQEITGVQLVEKYQLPDQHTDKLINNCSQFLDQIGGIERLFDFPLYHGFKQQYDDLTTKKSRHTSRKPTYTSLYVHTKVNHLFQNKFGHSYRNGLFATGDKMAASKHGHLALVVPKGHFSICYNEKIQHFYPELISAVGDEDEDVMLEYFRTEMLPDYKTGNLIKAIQSGCEIMIWCEDYFVVPIDQPAIIGDTSV